jgi:nucleoid DNA-binding protein
MARNIKEAICQDIAKELEIDIELVNKVIQFQGEDALRAVKEFKEVEFSGFGKFLLSQTKLGNRIKKLEDISQAYQLHIADPNTDTIKLNKSIGLLESVQRELEELKLRVCQK